MKPPFYHFRTWRRILVKAVLMLLIFDAVFIVARPFDRIEKYSVFGVIVPLRPRLMRHESNLDDQFMPLETLLNAHEISAPKGADEYRVAVLGDSGINGYGDGDDETISAYLNKADFRINGKKLRAYDLALPGTWVVRDLLTADAALDYQPDLFVWFVSLRGFQDKDLDQEFDINRLRFSKLVARFQLTDVNALADGTYSDAWWQHSVFAERFMILHWLKFQMYMFQEGFRYYEQPTIPDLPLAPLDQDKAFRNPTWKALTALPQLTSVPILIVNEPILITPASKPGADVNYDIFYGRAEYDDYRTEFASFCKIHTLWCADIWDLVPPTEFTNSPLHRTAAGNEMIASRILKEILSGPGNSF